MNPKNLNENEQFLEQQTSKITKISDKTIESLKIEMNWEGSGSKSDPIVIKQVKALPLIVKIYRSSLYYYIKNLTIDKLTCHNAQNITIENCTIKYLKIGDCDNITLVNNKIVKHKIVFAKGSTFIDNKIAQFEKFTKNHFTTQTSPLSGYSTNPITGCLCFMVIMGFLSWNSFGFIGSILFGLIFYLHYSTYIKNKGKKCNTKNIYANNVNI